MTTATVGGRYQVVIPSDVRNKFDIRVGDKVAIEQVGDHLELRVVDARRLRGIGRDMSGSKDPVSYVRELREEWETRR